MSKLNDFISTNTNSRWSDYITGFIDFVKDRFITYSDFHNILRKCLHHPDSKIGGFELVIKAIDGEDVFEFKEVIDATGPKAASSSELDRHNWYECHYTIYYKSVIRGDGTAKDQIKNSVLNLVDSFWKRSIRDDATRLWTLKLGESKQLLNSTLTYYRQTARYISFIYCDLDKFGHLNKVYGSNAGDSVLLQMSKLFTSFVVKRPAILIHDKGDEFVVLIFAEYIEEILSIAYEFQTVLQNAKYTVPTSSGETEVHAQGTFGFTITHAENNNDISFLTEIENAESAGKINGSKNYERANLFNSITCANPVHVLDSYSADISKLNLKVLPSKRIFKNIWLNLIADTVQLIRENDNFKAELQLLLKWISPVDTNTCAAFHQFSSKPDFSKNLSAFDILVAVVRGYVSERLEEVKDLSFSIHALEGKLILFAGTYRIFELSSSCVQELNIGTFFQKHLFPIALLVKIGHERLIMPERIFGATITIDDRPSRFGGLPDFWELALAKVVQKLHEDVNIRCLYVIGDTQYAKKSTEWFEKFDQNLINDSDMERLVTKTRATYAELNKAKSRLKGRIKHFTQDKDIVDDYSKLITDGSKMELSPSTLPTEKPIRILKRNIEIDHNGLTMRDGFRVKTLAEAYPLMLEIARQASNDSDSIRDQARSLLGELIDFKVELSNPTINLIPYYFKEDVRNFEEYFQKLFIDEKGLFAQHLRPQIELVLKHLEASLENEKRQYSTRRAILIIPNPSETEVAPLGLISVRIIPRIKSVKKLGLIFSFTWRTVEALVGFPYSFYGSVKYSQYLTKLLESRIKPAGFEVTFESVSYIAHSLHIFIDERGQEIAKSIINDASV